MGDSKVIQMGYVLTLTHIDPHEEHGGPPRNQKDVLHIFEVIFFKNFFGQSSHLWFG